MITTVLFSSGKISFNLPREMVAPAIAQSGSHVWADFSKPDNDEIAMLDEVFHFHPLAIGNCLAAGAAPHVMNLDDCVFVSLAIFDYDARQKKMLSYPLHLFIGGQHLITVHRDDLPVLGEAFEIIKQNPAATLGAGADFAAYTILGLVADHYVALLETIGDRIDKNEEHVYSAKAHDVSLELFKLKKEILFLRRTIAPLRDGVLRLTREDISVISPKVKIYFHDIHERLYRICETIDTFKDIVLSTQDLQLSLISHKTNQIVKTLTVITTVIMPLTLLSGIYGMNVRHLPPELEWRHGFYTILGAMGVIALISLAIFKKKKWF
ncbi:MAG TPA: magnesium/cobalt transporter CorA [bacterium]|nr:magnesium/cobalt transporter CorA [bacterium]